MQENCLFGSEGGAKLSFVPTPMRHFKRSRISQNVREERSPITSAFRSRRFPGKK